MLDILLRSSLPLYAAIDMSPTAASQLFWPLPFIMHMLRFYYRRHGA